MLKELTLFKVFGYPDATEAKYGGFIGLKPDEKTLSCGFIYI